MSGIGKLVVIAGPSGVGKGTLASYIVKNFPGFAISVSATTRPPRVGEVQGQSYFFMTKEQFEQQVESGKMLEWAEVHGSNLYGTPREPVELALTQGLSVILEIDVQGAFQAKEAFPDAVLVFVFPPSFEELKIRLDKRGTETETEKQIRLETAKSELAAADDFDFSVVNDDVARCAKEVVDLVKST